MSKILTIKNNDFYFEAKYDDKKNRFYSPLLENYNLNPEKEKILKAICDLFPICKPHELYEHLIIRAENKIRLFDKIKYENVILSDKINDYYDLLNNLFRKSLKPYVKDQLTSKINFETIKPSEKWIYLNENKKRLVIIESLEKFINNSKFMGINFNIIRIEKHTDIFLSLDNVKDIDMKNEFCLDAEIHLKKDLDESINLYLETMHDKNKGRRLKV